MKSLREFIYVFEGGMGGHMKHPFDYTDFTCKDLIELISDIFSGKIINMKEKLDGTNIQATMNPQGDIVFIRNKGDLNSPTGGMSVQDMADKWKDKPTVASNFVKAGKIISQIFSKIPNNWFNPDKDTKVIVNCECISAGKTNVMLYNSDRVAFHGTVTYHRTEDNKWEMVDEFEGIPDEIQKATVDVEVAKPRPNLIINSVEKAQKFKDQFIEDIKKLFRNEGLTELDSIETWKKKRFEDIAPTWITDKDTLDKDTLFNRWFNQDKSVNVRVLKKTYADHIDELMDIDKKGYKEYVGKVMKPLDMLFLKIGNAIISICDGFTNQGNEAHVIDTLKNDIKDVVNQIKANGSTDTQDKLEIELNRLKDLNDQINAGEGITFVYKGKLMKLTGSFAPLNQILGAIKFAR